MNNGSVQFMCPSKTLNLQQLNETQPWVILLLSPVTCESVCVWKRSQMKSEMTSEAGEDGVVVKAAAWVEEEAEAEEEEELLLC